MSRTRTSIAQKLKPLREDILKFADALGFNPSKQQKDLLVAVQRAADGTGPRQISIRSGQGPGKCLKKGTEIIDVTQGRVTVDQVSVAKVFSKSPKGDLQHRDAPSFDSGRKQCLRVTAANGTWVDVSEDHPILTQRGYVQAQHLVDGDLLCSPRRLTIPDAQALKLMPDEVVVLAAYFGADGGTTEAARFTNETPQVIEEFCECVESIGGGITVNNSRSNAAELSATGIMDYVRAMGYAGCGARIKRTPSWSYVLPDRQVALFLNRFWACDGYVEKDGFSVILASEGLIRDLQTLLLRLGVSSNFRYKESKCDGKSFDSWRLSVRGADAIRFYEVVGAPLGKEEASEGLYERLTGTVRNTNTDVIPVTEDVMREVCDELGVSYFQIRPFCRPRPYISRQVFQRFCETTGYSGEHAWHCTSDLRWTRFETSEPIGEHEVWDLSVPPYGNFVAQNLVVHNTATSAVVGGWRLLRNVDSQLVVTAPTMRQCSDVWLSEFKMRLERAPDWLQRMFLVTKKRIVVAGRDTWGCTTVTATKPENAQGFHRHTDVHGTHIPLTIIAEEASGISRPIIEQFLGTMSNPDTLFLMIGNPNTRDCYFFDTHHGPQARNWLGMRWNAEDSPWVTKEHCHAIGEEFGFESDVYRIRVLGEFPYSDPNCVMSSEDVYPLMDEDRYHDALRFRYDGERDHAIGIDFARFGGDESVICARSGLAVVEFKHYARHEPTRVADAAFRIQSDLAWDRDHVWYVPDAGGMGQGVLGRFYERNKQVHEFHNNGRSSSPKEFDNKITEAYFHLARLSKRLYKDGSPYFEAPLPYLPEDQILLRQLTSRQYYMNKKNRLVLESKDEYMKRGFESPDRAEAVAMAFYPKIKAQGRIATARPGQSMRKLA